VNLQPTAKTSLTTWKLAVRAHFCPLNQARKAATSFTWLRGQPVDPAKLKEELPEFINRMRVNAPRNEAFQQMVSASKRIRPS